MQTHRDNHVGTKEQGHNVSGAGISLGKGGAVESDQVDTTKTEEDGLTGPNEFLAARTDEESWAKPDESMVSNPRANEDGKVRLRYIID